MSHKFKIGYLVIYSWVYDRDRPIIKYQHAAPNQYGESLGIILGYIKPNKVFSSFELRRVREKDNVYLWFSQNEQQEFAVFENELEEVK